MFLPQGFGQGGGLFDMLKGKLGIGTPAPMAGQGALLAGVSPTGGAPVMGDYSGGDAGEAPPPAAAAAPRHGLGGLLDKLGTPDGRGLSFGDKLFAAGSVLQGDSGGAATYIQNQRSAADALSERRRSRDLASKGAADFAASIDPETGAFDAAGYMRRRAAGGDFDPDKAVGVATSMAPKIGYQNAGGGGLYETRQSPLGGPSTVTQKVAPPAPKARTGMMFDENGVEVPDPHYLDYLEQSAAARRRGAPPVARKGGGGGGGAKPPAWLPPGARIRAGG